ncbi:MAG: acyltransferase family protein [Dokdonella sp.]|nr:acyltransferase [Dokdonella sp.]MCB1574066.1 acyltransferase [Xanthomonadales bacterium]MCB1576362.1 acyltransferase [Xanthomonadales bacterium]
MDSTDGTARTGSTLSHSPRADYLPFVDGLRAIAVIAVIVYHLRPAWLPGGFAGVDVFFVISGFVVSASVSRWDRGGLRELLAYFYARRMQRIAPALVACLLATMLASALFIPTAWLSSSNDMTGLFAFVGLSNFYLAANHADYFSPSTDFNPFTHTWSLGVEEQFYLVFPLLFFAWTRGGRWRQLALALFGLTLLCSLGDAWLRAQRDPGAAFYLISTRFWQLASGVLLFLGLSRWSASDALRMRLRRTANAGAWLALALLGASFWISAPGAFPFPGAWMPVLATLGLLALVQREHSRSLLSAGLASGAMVAIGQRSYSLYLWHWPVLVLLRWTTGIQSWPLALAAVVLTVVLAELSYRWVEAPLRYSPVLRQWPRIRVLAAGLVAIAACAAVSVVLVRSKPVVSLSTVMRHADEWYPEALKSLPERPGCIVSKSKRQDGTARSRVYARTGCAVEPGAPAPALFALGDSHALGYVTLLSEYVLRTGAPVTLYPNSGCSYANLRSPVESAACVAQHKAILADIARTAKPGDVVFLAALRLNRLSDQDGMPSEFDVFDSLRGRSAEQLRHKAELALLTELRTLRDAGVRIVFEAPKPLLPVPAFRCSDVFNAGNPVCAAGLSVSRSAMEDYRRPVVASLDRLASALDASVWDPFDLLCPGPTCTAARDDHPLFFDGDHISAYANRLLYPSFAKFILAGQHHQTR